MKESNVLSHKFFKHVPEQFADKFESGESIQIGTLDYYKNLENYRSDKMEGYGQYGYDGVLSPQHLQAPEYALARKSAGLPEEGFLFGSTLYIANNKFINCLRPLYIFCGSKEPDFKRVEKYKECIFEITNISAFSHELIISSNGHIKDVEIREIKYRKRLINPFEENINLSQSPFIKEKYFSYENEIRVVFKPNSNSVPKTKIINSPKAAEYITRINP
jgi:hypothetical protein